VYSVKKYVEIMIKYLDIPCLAPILVNLNKNMYIKYCGLGPHHLISFFAFYYEIGIPKEGIVCMRKRREKCRVKYLSSHMASVVAGN
jgi:hypothetical protein